MTVKYGRFFTLVLFGHRDEKKVEKFHPEKRLDFRVGSNWHIFWFLNFLNFCHNILQNHQNVKGCFGKFRKFAARWAQTLLKLMRKCLKSSTRIRWLTLITTVMKSAVCSNQVLKSSSISGSSLILNSMSHALAWLSLLPPQTEELFIFIAQLCFRFFKKIESE